MMEMMIFFFFSALYLIANYFYCDSQVGIYVATAKRLPNICVILVHILCAKDVIKKKDFYVLEGTRAFVRLATTL